jgi:hypothetical protein
MFQAFADVRPRTSAEVRPRTAAEVRPRTAASIKQLPTYDDPQAAGVSEHVHRKPQMRLGVGASDSKTPGMDILTMRAVERCRVCDLCCGKGLFSRTCTCRVLLIFFVVVLAH